MRLLSAMLGTAGIVAVWLAALGLYGVVAHAVVRRTREIGIRMALGRDAPRRAGARRPAGRVFRWPSAPRSARPWRSRRPGPPPALLFGVDATDPLAWGGAVLTLAAVGGLAHAVPARRAVRVAPAAALRVE